MSNLLRPVGPLPPRVYWVRRLAVLAVALCVVIVLAVIVAKVAGGSAAGKEDAPGASEPSEPTGDSTDASGTPPQCADADLRLALASDRSAYGSGKNPKFSIEVTNGGEDPCLVDVNDKSLSVRVVSGKDRIWTSSFCVEENANLLLMRPTDVETVTKGWNRARNDKSCSSGLAQAKPGTYRVHATLGGAKSEELVFTLS